MFIMKVLYFVLACFGVSSTLSLVLPIDFTIQSGPHGPTLTWSSESVPLRVGGSRIEFRFADGTLLGYPRERQGALQLILTPAQLQTLVDQETALEVWSSDRRIDAEAPERPLRPGSAVAVTASSTPQVSVDPGKKGIYKTLRKSYNVSTIDVDGVDVPIEVVGEVTYPQKVAGKRPLVLFLHGYYYTCYRGGPSGEISYDWPCPEGWLSIPSYKGYRYVADVLASQGNIVVSISANAISSYEAYYSETVEPTALRSILIRHHLSLWAKWSTSGGSPWENQFFGRLDLNKVVLVGQQRGGEGVHRTAVDASPSDPFKIVGLVTYNSFAYYRPVTPDVHSANILSTCAGNGYELPGQVFVDASRDIAYSEALRSAVISVGTNAYFFNTEWTPGLAVAPALDDSDYAFGKDDPVCGSEAGSLRLTPQEQRVVGVAYTAALVKLATYQDITVLPLLDGSFVRPKAIGRAEVSVNAVGGAKNRLLYRPENDGQPLFRKGMTGTECVGQLSFLSFPNLPMCAGGAYVSPHWIPFNSRPSPKALELQWTDSPGAIVQFGVNSASRNLANLDSLDVRIANEPGNIGVRFDLMVVDNIGRSAALLSNLATIESWPTPNSIPSRVYARTLRGSLQSVRLKVDLRHIDSILLVSRSTTGRVWILDIAASQSRVQIPAVLNLPQLSIESASALETDGPKRYTLNIISDRPLTSPGSVWVESRPGPSYQLDLVPSTSTIAAHIDIDHVGDNLFSYPTYYNFFIDAVKGVVTGNASGFLMIEDDEPAPVLSVPTKDVVAREGQSLTWKFELSLPSTGFSLCGSVLPLTSGTELTSHDVPTSWLRTVSFFSPPSAPVPLSLLGIFFCVSFEYGAKTAQLSIPVIEDGLTEGDEAVLIEMSNYMDPDNVESFFLTGSVLAHS